MKVGPTSAGAHLATQEEEGDLALPLPILPPLFNLSNPNGRVAEYVQMVNCAATHTQ